jgi:hypothetical protein
MRWVVKRLVGRVRAELVEARELAFRQARGAAELADDHGDDSRPTLRILANMSSSRNRTSTDSTTRMGCPEPGR